MKKSILYEQLETTIAKMLKNDLLIVSRGWNAKVSPDVYPNWAGTAGKFGIGETKERGFSLWDLEEIIG